MLGERETQRRKEEVSTFESLSDLSEFELFVIKSLIFRFVRCQAGAKKLPSSIF